MCRVLKVEKLLSVKRSEQNRIVCIHAKAAFDCCAKYFASVFSSQILAEKYNNKNVLWSPNIFTIVFSVRHSVVRLLLQLRLADDDNDVFSTSVTFVIIHMLLFYTVTCVPFRNALCTNFNPDRIQWNTKGIYISSPRFIILSIKCLLDVVSRKGGLKGAIIQLCVSWEPLFHHHNKRIPVHSKCFRWRFWLQDDVFIKMQLLVMNIDTTK